MTRPRREWPSRWFAVGRLLLAVCLDPVARHEIDGDLLELWARRRDAGRRDLRRAYLRDVAGILRARGRWTTRLHATPSSRPLWTPGAWTMRQDLHYAVRMMRRRPGTSVATVLTLAIGIGAGAAIFTAVDRLLLRPVPFPAAHDLVFVERAPIRFGAGAHGSLAARFRALPVFSAMGTWASGGVNLDDTAGTRLAAAVVDDGFFATLGIAPFVGQPLPSPDGASRFAVLGYELWRSRFGSDRNLIGRSITLNSQPYTVTGVMPPGFQFPGRSEVWIPPGIDLQATGAAYSPEVVARLAAGVPLDQARQAVAAYDRATRAAAAQPTGVIDDAIELRPFGAELTRAARPTLLLLAGSVSLLLLVISASVSNLLLARVAARDQEFAVRRALGATRWRLARQLLVESLALSLLGGLAGALLARWGLGSLRVLAPATLDDLGFGAIDIRFLVLAIGVSVTMALVFGMAPGLAAALRDAGQVVRTGREDLGSPMWRRLRTTLVVGQMAIALALGAASLAAVHGLVNATRIDPGFGSARALAMTVTLPLARFETPPKVAAFFERAHERLAAVPGVRRVAATGFLPGSNELGVGVGIGVRGRPAASDADRVFATYLAASADYFTVAGIRLVAGRPFSMSDRAGAPAVAILSESTARRLFPDGSPVVGQFVETAWNPRSPAAHEVVGVVADVRLRSLSASPRALQQIYVPLLQSPPFGNLSFVAEVDGAPASAIVAMRTAMAEVDPRVPIYNAQPLDAVIDRYLASHRLAGWLVTGFALVTLAVAAIGLYALMAQRVTERGREFGIRVALGADPRRVRRGLVGRGLAHAAMGAALGWAGAVLAVRVTASVVPALTDVSASMFIASAATLLAVAIAATWIPATKVLRLDPARALRV
jgi:predicted permease